MSCALREVDWVELLVPIQILRLYAEILREFKVELKLENLRDADVVCTHGVLPYCRKSPKVNPKITL